MPIPNTEELGKVDPGSIVLKADAQRGSALFTPKAAGTATLRRVERPGFAETAANGQLVIEISQ